MQRETAIPYNNLLDLLGSNATWLPFSKQVWVKARSFSVVHQHQLNQLYGFMRNYLTDTHNNITTSVFCQQTSQTPALTHFPIQFYWNDRTVCFNALSLDRTQLRKESFILEMQDVSQVDQTTTVPLWCKIYTINFVYDQSFTIYHIFFF